LRHGSTGAAVGIAVQPGVPGARGPSGPSGPRSYPFPSPTAGDLWKPGILMMIYGDLYKIDLGISFYDLYYEYL